jgi:hypothetical protein
MDDLPTSSAPPEPQMQGGASYSLVGRVEAARGLYYWLTFVTGSLGLLVLIRPSSVGVLLPGIALSRWWGLLGLAVAFGLFATGRRLTHMELPEDFERRRRRAVDESNWSKVYEWTRLEADVSRQNGDVEREIEARERLVELALERLDDGEFQALRQLRRLERLADDPGDVTERIADLLRDLEAFGSLIEVLERRLDQLGDDGPVGIEAPIRRELLDLYESLDHWDEEASLGPMAHFEWLLEHAPSDALVDRLVTFARETDRADEATEHLERLGDDDALERLGGDAESTSTRTP